MLALPKNRQHTYGASLSLFLVEGEGGREEGKEEDNEWQVHEMTKRHIDTFKHKRHTNTQRLRNTDTGDENRISWKT